VVTLILAKGVLFVYSNSDKKGVGPTLFSV